MQALDALKALWILGVFLSMFLWLPIHLFSGRPNSPRFIQIAGDWTRAVLGVTILVFLLSSLRVLSVITIVLLLAGAIAVSWFRKPAGTPRRLLTNLQAATIKIIRSIESRSFDLLLLTYKRPYTSGHEPWRGRAKKWLRALEGKELVGACLVVVLGITIVLRTEHAFRELRFDQPEQYAALLRARELMLSVHSVGRPIAFPALIAATSLLSGMDPMQVTRFLTPAIDLFVVLATGLLIHVCARAGVASVAAIYCLGAPVFPPVRNQTDVAISGLEKIGSLLSSSAASTRARPEFALGLLFVLLGLVFLADWYRNSRAWDALLDFGCCLVLASIVSQVLLLVLVMSCGVLLLRPIAGLFVFAMLCYGLAACAMLSTGFTVPDETRSVLPVASAILVGCCLAFVEAVLIARTRRKAETVLLAACLSVAVIWLRPQRLLGRCLEYDVAARATLDIASKFPRQTWVVAAPVEQLAETFGMGGHEDLAGFVEKYRSQVSSPEFRFPDAREDLFIYVEKRPFQIFSREPESVSFSVLTDPTYRNYRSPGGRASLETAALQLCESYRQHHSNTDVFFENEVLRIYHIHHQPASDINGRQ